MPSVPTLMAFVLAVLAMQLVPGPETMLVVSRGIGEGRRVALWTVIGMTLLAGAVQLPLLALGIASVVDAWPWTYETLRLAGAAYLVWLGIRLLIAPRGAAATDGLDAIGSNRLAAMREGLIANMTNPNPIIFMLAFLPHFVDPSRGSITTQLLVLGAIQKVTGFAVLGLTALASGSLGSWLSRHRGVIVWQQRCAGMAMIALGIGLAARARS